MQMNPLFAAGMFDSPWLIIVIVLISALVNWLSKRRQEQQERRALEGDQPEKTGGGFNLEETLRRLLGEEVPAQMPPPPPIPRAARGELPPIPMARARMTAAAIREQQEQAADHWEELNDPDIRPAAVARQEIGSRPAKRAVSPWRDPRTARQAFVASVVFAPPKSLDADA